MSRLTAQQDADLYLTERQVADLRYRLTRAAAMMRELAEQGESERRIGRAQGAEIALAYLDEYERGLLR